MGRKPKKSIGMNRYCIVHSPGKTERDITSPRRTVQERTSKLRKSIKRSKTECLTSLVISYHF